MQTMCLPILSSFAIAQDDRINAQDDNLLPAPSSGRYRSYKRIQIQPDEILQDH